MYLVIYKETNYEWKHVTYNCTANQKDVRVTWCFEIFHKNIEDRAKIQNATQNCPYKVLKRSGHTCRLLFWERSLLIFTQSFNGNYFRSSQQNQAKNNFYRKKWVRLLMEGFKKIKRNASSFFSSLRIKVKNLSIRCTSVFTYEFILFKYIQNMVVLAKQKYNMKRNWHSKNSSNINTIL